MTEVKETKPKGRPAKKVITAMADEGNPYEEAIKAIEDAKASLDKVCDFRKASHFSFSRFSAMKKALHEQVKILRAYVAG